jgi:hypothetical protein
VAYDSDFFAFCLLWARSGLSPEESSTQRA